MRLEHFQPLIWTEPARVCSSAEEAVPPSRQRAESPKHKVLRLELECISFFFKTKKKKKKRSVFARHIVMRTAATAVLVWTPVEWTGLGFVPGLALSLGLGGQLLQQRVGLALGRFHTVGPHDAGGPVEVEHHHQLLPLLAQLLDLGLELRVDHLQPLRLLHRDTVSTRGSGPSCPVMGATPKLPLPVH